MKRFPAFHWPEYLIEAAGLGVFMISASSFAMLLFLPTSPAATTIGTPWIARGLMGLAMGGTAVALIYSPWGRQSGAHFNPAVTLTFYRLGKVTARDAAFYVLFQTAGGLLGLLIPVAVCRMWLQDPAVDYVATTPGPAGTVVAWVAEFTISFLLMAVILTVSNTRRFARYTGLCAGAMVALFILIAAPFSGMSMNPSRTLASAVPSGIWDGIWIYFTAPPLGMLLAAQLFLWFRGRQAIFCAKLHHQNNMRCIFCESRPANTDSQRVA